ncbi:MAG: DUF692 family protein [Bdellovibrionota bacterium]
MSANRALLCGVSLMPEPHWLQAALPLFESGAVEIVEWSFDTCWDELGGASWMHELLTHFSAAGRLLGHGVSLSLLSVENDYHDAWFKRFALDCERYSFNHVTEHFGFMRTRNFHRGAPLPVPYDPTLLPLANERLSRLQSLCKCPVGLENLALAFSKGDVQNHAEFLSQLVSGVPGGFILLDLHNLYCQAKNFDLPLSDLLKLYEPSLVREIHISGGSWSEGAHSQTRKIRRDTHDEAVPEELFDFLPQALRALPNVKAVIFEQLSSSLLTDQAQIQFRSDFSALRTIVEEYRHGDTV